MKKEERFTVIKDTREQDGWTFGAGKSCAGMDIGTLKTGDYTMRGYENILTIERKGSVAEFAANITQERFVRELERMRDYEFAFIVLEFTLDDIMRFPYGAGLPKSKIPFVRVRGPFILRRLMEFQINYPVKIILAGRHGMDVAHHIFRRVLDAKSPKGTGPDQAAD
jgi:ERCC4-type nuclease